MTWVKIDDQFPDHPKIERAGPEAAWLYVAGLCYCAQYLTDGLIPKTRVPRLTAHADGERLADRLVDAGLWEDRGEDYEVHDYLDFQPSGEEARARKRELSEKRAEAGKRGAEARWNGKHGKPDGKEPSPLPSPLPSDVDGKRHGKPMAPSPSPSPSQIPTSTDLDHSPASPTPGPDLFTDEFWPAYPRKVGKPKALAAWKSATKRTDPAVIVAGLEAWLPYWEAKGEPEFIPHPTTWLNQERWADTPPQASTPKQGRRGTFTAGLVELAQQLDGHTGAKELAS
jgi:hypothetical protein